MTDSIHPQHTFVPSPSLGTIPKKLIQPSVSPSSETLSPGIDQIPFEGLEDIGAIFHEGESKYGRDNWKKQPDNPEYNAERCRHAIRHLYLYANGDRSENHLAKVAWFCVTTIWRSKQQASITSKQVSELLSTSEPLSQT